MEEDPENYGYPNVAKFNNLHIYIQQLIFMLNKIYFYPTVYSYIQQYAFSFHIQLNYFYSTSIAIFILLDKINCSTSVQTFTQQK